MNPIPLPRGASAMSPTAATGIPKMRRSFLTAEDVTVDKACGVVDSASAPASPASVLRWMCARRSLGAAIVWATRSPDVLVGTERAGNSSQFFCLRETLDVSPRKRQAVCAYFCPNCFSPRSICLSGALQVCCALHFVFVGCFFLWHAAFCKNRRQNGLKKSSKMSLKQKP